MFWLWVLGVVVVLVLVATYGKKRLFSVLYMLFHTPVGFKLFKKLSKGTSKPPHSQRVTVPIGQELRVHIVPVFRDNYCYILEDVGKQVALLVDPADPEVAMETLSSLRLTPVGILTTHYHWDHAGGNDELTQAYPDLVVYGGEQKVRALTRLVRDGDFITFGNAQIRVLSVPCHTRGHVVYFLPPSMSGAGSLFTGDTLFCGGCGKFFEGDAGEMLHAMQRLQDLPGATRVFPGHEYTVHNLAFDITVEPTNPDVLGAYERARAKRAQKEPTVPSTLADEKRYNPFLRVDQPAIQAFCGVATEIDAMRVLRERKDAFRRP